MAELLFTVSNHHTKACAPTTRFDGDERGAYLGYFSNEHGEQAIYVYDWASGEATVRMGDAGWDSVHRVVDGRIEGTTVTEAEARWIRACWMATGALKTQARPEVDEQADGATS